MKSALKEMLATLRTPRHPHYQSLLDFPLIDAAALSDRLGLASNGRRRGEIGEPAPESHGLDNVEQQIVTEIDNAKTRAHGQFLDHSTTLAQRLANLDLRLFVTQIKEAALATQADFKTAVNQGKDDLYIARQRLLESDQELKDFRDYHQLGRPARLPGSRLLTVGITIFVFALEAYLNGSFLGEAHAFGLLGGYIEAAAVAFINVVTAFLLSWTCLGFAIHRNPAVRIVALALFIAYALAVLALNLGFAHYRDLLVNTMSDTAPLIALQRFLTDPFGIVDIKSWYLFILGLVFWVIALYEGRRMDDPYPGYGDLNRRHEDAVRGYREIKEDVYEELRELRDDLADAMEGAKRELNSRRSERAAVNESRHRLTNGFQQHLAHLEQLANHLMSVYREANAEARRRCGQRPPPQRFNERWVMTQPQYGVPSQEDPRSLDDLVQEGIGELDHVIARTNEQYEEAIKQFQTIDQLMSSQDRAHGTAT